MEILQFIGTVLLGFLAFWKLTDIMKLEYLRTRQASILLGLFLYSELKDKPLNKVTSEEASNTLLKTLKDYTIWAQTNAQDCVTIVEGNPKVKQGLINLLK